VCLHRLRTAQFDKITFVLTSARLKWVSEWVVSILTALQHTHKAIQCIGVCFGSYEYQMNCIWIRNINDLLLVIHSNFGPISYRFLVKRRLAVKIHKFSHPYASNHTLSGSPWNLVVWGAKSRVMPLPSFFHSVLRWSVAVSTMRRHSWRIAAFQADRCKANVLLAKVCLHCMKPCRCG